MPARSPASPTPVAAHRTFRARTLGRATPRPLPRASQTRTKTALARPAQDLPAPALDENKIQQIQNEINIDIPRLTLQGEPRYDYIYFNKSINDRYAKLFFSSIYFGKSFSVL